MSKYHPKNLLTHEPVAFGSALVAILNVLVLLRILALSVEQITGINVAVVMVLALFTRKAVTPNVNVSVHKNDVGQMFEELDGLGNVYPFPDGDDIT